MRIKSILVASLYLMAGTFVLSSCQKTNEEFTEEYPVESFLSLKLRDSSFFRLDSLELTPFRQDFSKFNSYLVKEEVADIVYDNLNQPFWKINRFINKDTTGKGNWNSYGYYLIAARNNQLIMIEDNWRFIKMNAPVRNNFIWKGNSFLPNEAFPEYDFSIDNNMLKWDFTYTDVGSTEIVGNNSESFEKVVTIQQTDQALNVDNNNNILIANSFATREKSIEKYAQNTGLVYREQILWEFQPTKGKKIGFMLKMWRINK